MSRLDFSNKSVFAKEEEPKEEIKITENSVVEIPLELIDIGENIRDMSTDQELEELGQTIREYGQLEPCIVHKEGERYIVEMGSRRYKACKLEDIPTLKCIVRNKFTNDKERIIIQAIENEHRRDMSSREREVYMAKLIELGMNQIDIAKALHKNKGWVSEALKAYTNYQKDKDIFDGLGEEISTRTMADTANLSTEQLKKAVEKAKVSNNAKKTFSDEIKKQKKENKQSIISEDEENETETNSFEIFDNSRQEKDEKIKNLNVEYTVSINEVTKTVNVNSLIDKNEELNSYIKNQIRIFYLDKGYKIND